MSEKASRERRASATGIPIARPRIVPRAGGWDGDEDAEELEEEGEEGAGEMVIVDVVAARPSADIIEVITRTVPL